MRKSTKLVLALSFASSLFLFKNVLIADSFSVPKDYSLASVKNLKGSLNKIINSSVNLPNQINIDGNNYKIEYSLNEQLENFIKNQIKSHRPDYASVVVIDNDKGRVLSAVDYSKNKNAFGRQMTFASTHPAASIFKIVTAAELLKQKKVQPESVFSFNGRSTTLYKYQLENTPRRRWIRNQTFAEAFAKSNNVIFGRAGVNYLNADELIQAANNLGLTENIFEEINLDSPKVMRPNSDYRMAELSSGFNTDTVMSPVHGAVIASIVANDGVFKNPNIVSKIYRNSDEVIWQPKAETKTVLAPEITKDLQEMMQLTVEKGTARRSFRRATTHPFSSLEIGGKTGSITGGEPFGKRDWFVSYAKPKDQSQGKGLAICVMIVNQKRWYVKSTQVAKDIIGYYYKNLVPLRRDEKISAKQFVKKPSRRQLRYSRR